MYTITVRRDEAVSGLTKILLDRVITVGGQATSGDGAEVQAAGVVPIMNVPTTTGKGPGPGEAFLG